MISNYDDYKQFLLEYRESLGPLGRGFSSKLAKAASVQNSFISQVVNGTKHLNVEQAIDVASFLKLGPIESEFFVLLVEFSRAGTPASRRFFKKLIDEKRSLLTHNEIRSRAKIKTELTDSDKAIYYSSSIYAVVHMATTIKELQSFEALCKRVGVESEKLKSILNFLINCNLVEEKSGKFCAKEEVLFVDKSSPFLRQHHANSRILSLKSIESMNDEDIHLTYFVSLSKKDINLVRKKILEFIESTSDGIKKSKAEELVVLNLDFFKA